MTIQETTAELGLDHFNSIILIFNLFSLGSNKCDYFTTFMNATAN